VVAAAIVAAAPSEQLRGTLIAIDRRTGIALVRHAAFGGMPAMTMEFRLATGTPRLEPGDAVSARVDERTAPWTLFAVRTPAAPPRRPPVRAYVPPLRAGDAVPRVSLANQRGRRFTLASEAGTTTILSFIYTRCRDARMCPLVAAKFARMQRTLHGMPIRLVTVTLDPAYDTPRVLARYAAAFGADPRVWTLAAGSIDTTNELAARFGLAVDRPEPGVIVHSEAVVVIDARGRVARIVDGALWSPDDVEAAAREVAGAPSNPLRRWALWFGESAGAMCGGPAAGGITVGAALAVLAGTACAFGWAARRALP
jgi:protein SCO1/2